MNKKFARLNEQLRIVASAFESKKGMLITDSKGLIVRVNRAFTKITGYSSEDAFGKNPRLLSSGHHNANFYKSMWENIQLKGEWEGEIWNRRKSGEIYVEHLTITAVKGEDGNVTYYVATLGDITERKQAEEQIHSLAFYDVLTQLPNRRLLNDRLEQAMAASKRSGHYGALMFLDLDNFKPLNDKYGHDVGDSLLVEVAHRISSCVRGVDTVARFGGDEFMVLLGDLVKDKTESTVQAGIVAEKIREALSISYVLESKQKDCAETTIEHRCTASIGVVLLIDQVASAQDIVKWSDIAMYQAKASGRNRVQFYEPKS